MGKCEKLSDTESKDSDGNDLPISRTGSRSSSRSRGETTPDRSLSRPSSRTDSALNLPAKNIPLVFILPALIPYIRTAIGIVCLIFEKYFVVFRFDNGEFAMLEKNRGNMEWNVTQGMEIAFFYKDFVQEFWRMKSFITEITKRLPQTRKWRLENDRFQMVFHYKESAREIMRGVEEGWIDILSTENVQIRVPFCLRRNSFRQSVYPTASDFRTGAAWCRLEMGQDSKWIVYESYEGPDSMRPPFQRMEELPRPSVFNPSTYHPDDGLSRLPGRRKTQKAKKPLESSSDSDDDGVKWEDIAPVGRIVPDPQFERRPNNVSRSENRWGRQENEDSQNRSHHRNEERNPNGTREEHPGRSFGTFGTIYHRRGAQYERWNREEIFGFNDRNGRDEFPLDNGYQRAQRRNFELEEIPRGESSSGGGQNGPCFQQGNQFNHSTRNRVNGINYFDRRNDHQEGSSNMYRNGQHHTETRRGSTRFVDYNLSSRSHTPSERNTSVADTRAVQKAPSNSGTSQPVRTNSAQSIRKNEDSGAKKVAQGKSAHVKSYETICQAEEIRKELYESVKASLRNELKACSVTSFNEREVPTTGSEQQDGSRTILGWDEDTFLIFSAVFVVVAILMYYFFC